MVDQSGWVGTDYTYTATHPHAVAGLNSVITVGGNTASYQTASYTYDQNGNMTCRMESGAWFIQTYNAENRLASVTKLASGDFTNQAHIKPYGISLTTAMGRASLNFTRRMIPTTMPKRRYSLHTLRAAHMKSMGLRMAQPLHSPESRSIIAKHPEAQRSGFDCEHVSTAESNVQKSSV